MIRSMSAESSPLLFESMRSGEKNGLTEEEAGLRLERFGANVAVSESVLPRILGPVTLMVVFATGAIAFQGNDVVFLFSLSTVFCIVDFLLDKAASKRLATSTEHLNRTIAVRGGQQRRIEAKYLVPGDLVILKAGDVVAADCRIVGGCVETDDRGEDRRRRARTGSVVRRGLAEAVVVSTGSRRAYPRAKLSSSGMTSLVFGNTVALFLFSGTACSIASLRLFSSSLQDSVGTLVAIVVLAIPITMKMVPTRILVVGAQELAEKHKTLVSRLGTVSQLAGLRVLCSNKTGTLTQNKLRLFEPVLVDQDMTTDELSFVAAMASGAASKIAVRSPIDSVVVSSLSADRFKGYQELEFIPFNPVSRRTEARISGHGGDNFRATNGAPDALLELCSSPPEERKRVEEAVLGLAKRGLRSLGVARGGKGGPWKFCGVLSLFDPQRTDSKIAVEKIGELNLDLCLMTGDHGAVATETIKAVSLSPAPIVVDSKEFEAAEKQGTALALAEKVDAFAQMRPGHKYRVVRLLQQQNQRSVGATGEYADDAPALTQAHVGIAIDGATDAARAASDVVLTQPGLLVIVDAIKAARCIVARVRNYFVYRLASTLHLVLFLFFACLCFQPRDYYCAESSTESSSSSSSSMYYPKCELGDGHDYFEKGSRYPYYYESAKYSFYIPVVGIVVVVALVELCSLTLSKDDRAIPSQYPRTWEKIRFIAAVLSLVPLASSLLIFYLGLSSADGSYPRYAILFGQRVSDEDRRYYLPYPKLVGMMYFQLLLSIVLSIFSVRTEHKLFFLEPSPPPLVFGTFATAAIAASLFAVSATLPGNGSSSLSEPISAKACAFVWIYNLVWVVVQDVAKILLFKMIDRFDNATKERADQDATYKV